MGVDDRYWDPISPAEAEGVLGAGTRILASHRRWLFAAARCRAPDGRELYLKRQPRMGRSIDQLAWQHRLTNHLADRGVPAARAVGIVDRGELWYELVEPAAGEDVYTDTDTWEPFRSVTHVQAAGRMLARLHEAGRDFQPLAPQPQAGFVVQLDAGRDPVSAVAAQMRARPAVADYLRGVRFEADVAGAYGGLFQALRPLADGLGVRPLHGDWQTNNLFFRGDRVSGIIDFHQADCGPRILDLAVAVERNCFFWNRISQGDDDAWDAAHARALIAAYDAGPERLTALEREAFPSVLAACQLEYGISFLDYYWGVERDREKADWAWHTFVLGHARWWQSGPGREAMRVIREAVGAAAVP